MEFAAAQVLAAQEWQAPDSTQFLAALCKFLQEDGAAFFSAERGAVVHVSPLPPFCEEAKDTSGEEEHVVGRLGLTIETPLTASMVDVDASDVLHSTASLTEVRSPTLTVAFSHSSYILMTYRVVGARRCSASWRRPRSRCLKRRPLRTAAEGRRHRRATSNSLACTRVVEGGRSQPTLRSDDPARYDETEAAAQVSVNVPERKACRQAQRERERERENERLILQPQC